MTDMKKRVGFNMLWAFSKGRNELPQQADPAELDFIAGEGFNFIRIPTDYRYFVPDGDFAHPREEALERIDEAIRACVERGLHASLNVHRAPGYCINRPEIEGRNLWRDEGAQADFITLWRMFADRYRGIPGDQLSFDLLNEPSQVLPSHPCTRDDHERVIRAAVKAVQEEDLQRQIIIDGFQGGHEPLPELADLGTDHGVIHSGRGYMPFGLTHHRAEWVRGGDMNAPEPVYPSEEWNIGYLRDFYSGWRELNLKGVPVHIGEFGCYNKVDNATALRWFEDLLTVYREYGWGYALWNFRGAFGIVEHGRPGAVYENYHGFPVDRALLELLRP